MKYQAIFFDLDGTLLPMDNDRFTQGISTFWLRRRRLWV